MRWKASRISARTGPTGPICQRPGLRAITVATPNMASLVGRRPERCAQFFVDGHLDRDADLVVDQLAEGGLKLLRSCGFLDTLRHGPFLRWPPARAAGWSCTSPTGRMRHRFST